MAILQDKYQYVEPAISETKQSLVNVPNWLKQYSSSQGKTDPVSKFCGLPFIFNITSEAHTSQSLWCTTKITQTHNLQVLEIPASNCRPLRKYVPGTPLPLMFHSCLERFNS